LKYLVLALIALALPASAITPQAEEFIEVMKKLEPVQCQKRQLRREIAVAQAEKRADDARDLRERFAKLNRDPETTRLEKRLAELEKKISRSDSKDMEAISFQQRSAFYRCE
jgi:hypothetical protein